MGNQVPTPALNGESPATPSPVRPRPPGLSSAKFLAFTAILVLALYGTIELLSLAGLAALHRFQNIDYRPLLFESLTPEDSEPLQKLIEGRTSYIAFSPAAGWSIKPNGVQPPVYRANAQGIRADREFALTPPRGVTRIAAFGDSFTHGDGVTNQEMWTAVLEAALPGTEVLNFGVGAYGLDQAYLRYRLEGARFRSALVLIGLMTESPRRHVNVYRPSPSSSSAPDGRWKPDRIPARRCVMGHQFNPGRSATYRWFRVVAGVMLATLLGAPATESVAEILDEEEQLSVGVGAEAYCSPTKPGTALVELKWRVSNRRMSQPELSARAAQQDVEVTVYRDGFERGLFARLPSVAPRARFTVAPQAATAGQAIPGLAKLTVTDVVTSRDTNRPDRMRLFSPAADDTEFVVTQIEGLEPGLNYYWRLPSVVDGQRPVVTSAGPVCPVDYRTPQKRTR